MEINKDSTENMLYVRPISWSVMNEKMLVTPSIQIFGYTKEGNMIYVRIPRRSTYILKFAEEIDDDIVSNIEEILNPIYIQQSHLDPTVLIVRAPELSPIELAGNPDYEKIATWSDVRQDPYGELASFWEAKEIGPYEWISIEKYAPLPGKYTSCDFNITTDESYIRNASDNINVDIPQRLFFWNIEVFSNRIGEFPSSLISEDNIFMITIITVNEDSVNKYVLVKGIPNNAKTFDIQRINDKYPGMIIVNVKDERDLISHFFAIYNIFQPDRQIYYNGDSFAMPYLLNRLTIHGMSIPKISKILSFSPKRINQQFSTPFGSEIGQTINLPGTEIIDLIHYYRRFYPYLRNHSLNTISNKFIGDGKTDLTNDEMIDAIRMNDINKIGRVIEYSYVNSLKMCELWNFNDAQGRIDLICNNLGINIDTLLHSNFSHIVDLIVYNIDAGAVFASGNNGRPHYIKEASNGIYQNVYIYDYSELYRQLLIKSDQKLASTLGERLEGAPSQLILESFYSKYINREELLPLLIDMLDTLINTKLVIAIEPTIIRSVGSLDTNWIKILDIIPFYIPVSKASYIILNNKSEIEKSGLSKLCRPKFKLANDIIDQYIISLYSDDLSKFTIPVLEDMSIENYILTEKIGDIGNLPPSSIKYLLASQYGDIINSWISVKYVLTLDGPKLLSNLSTDDILDYNYYHSELFKYINDLQNLQIFGI